MSTPNNLVESKKYSWYIYTNIINSITNRNATPEQKLENKRMQLRSRNQQLIIRIVDDEGKIIKIRVPVLITANLLSLSNLNYFLDQKHPTLSDDNRQSVISAYNEWLNEYIPMSTSYIQPNSNTETTGNRERLPIAKPIKAGSMKSRKTKSRRDNTKNRKQKRTMRGKK